MLITIHSCCLDDPRKSRTFRLIEENGFSEQYGTPGSFVKGDFVSDTVTVGKLSAKKQVFAVAKTSAEVPQGILGIGLDENESLISGGGKPYSNFISSLASQGAIGSMTYSIYMDGPGKHALAFSF